MGEKDFVRRKVISEGFGPEDVQYNSEGEMVFNLDESTRLQSEVLAYERALQTAETVQGCIYNFVSPRDRLLSTCSRCDPGSHTCANCDFRTPVNVKLVGESYVLAYQQRKKAKLLSTRRGLDYSLHLED